MSSTFSSCIVYNSPSHRGADFTTTGSSEHKRASAMPSQGSLFNNFEDVQLTDEERVYLNAASLGDVGIVRETLEEENQDGTLNANCVDYMGRNALHLAVDSEKIDVIEILLDNLSFNCIEESLLHAISKGATKIVKVISEHPNFMAGEDRFLISGVNEAFFRTEEKSQFPPDITPIILASHYNNHEIVQMFLSRNHRIERPHAISCRCSDCISKQNYDSLKRSRSRLNAYRALASPAYMALSSADPIMTTFELRQEMMHLAEVEKEFMAEYLGLVEQCMNFACELMDMCRGTQEVEAVFSEGSGSGENVRVDPLARLKMAIRYREKKFVAHPNCQQHMTTLWYGPEMGFLQSLPSWKQLAFATCFIPCIPVMCVAYVMAPNTKAGSVMRCPVTKFITHTTSHMCFLVLLAAATFRLTESGVSITSTREMNSPAFVHLSHEEKIQSLMKETLRPSSTLLTHVQICIVFWILGLLWIECKQIYHTGARSYLTDYINFMDFSVLSMYLASYVMRFFTEYKVSNADRYFNGTMRATQLLKNSNYTYFNLLLDEIKDSSNSPTNYFMEASRFHWKPDDPEIVSDVLFAIANVISFARTTYLMPAFEVLGPLQISLGRMIGDITRFMVLFMLVLFAFMVGLHNLYWYYGAQRIKMTMNGQIVYVHAAEAFQGLRQTFYSLFWSMFGQVSINDINVKHPGPEGIYSPNDPESLMKSSTSIVEGVGLTLFGIYHVVIIIVLINMLIAMMSHSFEDIQTDCDVEWKFARTKLWLNYMDEGSTLPVPFNMIPSIKSFCYLWKFCRDLFAMADSNWSVYQKARKQTFIKKRRENICKSLELKTDNTSYSEMIQRLVKRYLFKLERAKDEKENYGGPNIRSEEVEIADMNDTPPPVPNAPNRIQYATPPTIHEDEEEGVHMNSKSTYFNPSRGPPPRRKGVNRRVSNPAAPAPTTLVIPQLDAIQRSQKLLDVRLQHLQTNSKMNTKIIDDIEFLRRVMNENQKALCNIIQALGSMQCEIVNLVKCFAPVPTQTQNNVPNTHSQQNSIHRFGSGKKRPSHVTDDDESEV
ncbi:short transient receptor potential channel 3-like [Pecten maximus]|uniref:short transient receptor potential channel 3-like n=1 Tax=Pecten maximus TaxID=6579 RepID=UPI001458C250|nr:short transient receptor potential channel 3-like [Pecten maximus]